MRGNDITEEIWIRKDCSISRNLSLRKIWYPVSPPQKYVPSALEILNKQMLYSWGDIFVLLGSQVHLKFIPAFGILDIRSWKRNKHQDWHLKEDKKSPHYPYKIVLSFLFSIKYQDWYIRVQLSRQAQWRSNQFYVFLPNLDLDLEIKYLKIFFVKHENTLDFQPIDQCFMPHLD